MVSDSCPGCALISCRQTTSGFCFATHVKNPFLWADRIPFALRVVTFIMLILRCLVSLQYLQLVWYLAVAPIVKWYNW